MSRRPVVGVATQSLDAIPGKLPNCWIMGQRYVRILAAAGAVPWLIPLIQGDESTLRAVYDHLDGVFLTGGVDMDPAHYGEERHESCERIDPARDWTEIHLVRWAQAEGKPVFGVCRGIQAINVALGGSLYQDVPSQYPQAIKHDYFPSSGDYTRDYVVHDIEVTRGSRLGALLGAGRVRVNSMHHQGVKQLAPGLVASAFAPDGLIEGLEGVNGQFLVGVQWHPEELTDQDPAMRRLFGEFIAAGAAFHERA
jgi:putative glutamine amidotransferase